jgi:flagella basal body P-ring formation protein FlgA
MRCISRSITLLVSTLAAVAAAASTPGVCVLVDGARIRAADLAASAPAFAGLPPDKDLGAAPAGTMVRILYRAQLAALLPEVTAELPERLCVKRKREIIPAEVWQAAVDATMTSICGETPWKGKVEEAPNHPFPSGEIVFKRAGLVVGRGSVHLWRGALVLPDKSTVPVWVRAEIQAQRRARILRRPVAAGGSLTAEDVREEEIWAPGLCAEEREPIKLNGMVAKRAMPVGTVLAAEDLRRAPAVQRGEAVELEAASGPARLRVPTVAEHDAEVGDKVQLKSSWNGTRLVGRVTGAQKAKVE